METETNNNVAEDQELKGRKLIGIDGHWYDVSAFIPHHPGGDVIEKFVGKDATAVFHAFHREGVLKRRRPCAKMKPEDINSDPITKSFLELEIFFKEQGYFKYDYSWYTAKFIGALFPLSCCFYLVVNYQHPYVHYIAAVFLAAFWQQCGFFMHDFEHNHFTGNRHIDQWLGTFFGTICFGISGSWWRDEHFIHHALTTTVDVDTGFFDPQMREPIWAQSKKLWPFYKTKLEYYCVKIQHITFIPICVFIGRIAIMMNSMSQERRVSEIIAIILHWTWVLCLLSLFPNYKQAAIFYAIAAVCQGVLHIQLLISHYAKSFHDLKDISTDISWYQMQVESNIDITNPWWLDWFHGGLNFHLIHHLYPRMPRNNYRRATEHLKEVCKKNDLHYDHCCWTEAVQRTLKHLKLMSHHFELDPR